MIPRANNVITEANPGKEPQSETRRLAVSTTVPANN